MIKKVFIIVMLLILLIILFYLLQEVWILEIYTNGKELHFPVKIGDYLNLTYKHSVYGDKVLQVFKIGEGVITLNSIISTVRVIEYSYPNQKYELIDGLAHIKSLNLTVNSLQVIGYEKLEYGNKIIFITESFTKNVVRIKVKKIFLFNMLLEP